MCQKSLNFTSAFKCYQQNVTGITLAGPPGSPICAGHLQAVLLMLQLSVQSLPNFMFCIQKY